MKLKRIKAVELKLTVTLRFTGNVSEQEARQFLKSRLVPPTEDQLQSNTITQGLLDPASVKVFVASKTTFNTEI